MSGSASRDKAAVEYSSRVIVLTTERDGLTLKGIGAVAGLLIGVMAPGGREAARNLLKGLSTGDGAKYRAFPGRRIGLAPRSARAAPESRAWHRTVGLMGEARFRHDRPDSA